MKLETNRLILREWGTEDIEELIEGLNNLAVSRWLAYVPYPYTVENAKSWISLCKTKSIQDNSYEFAVVLKSENKTIGGLSLTDINRVHGTVGGGIWINQNYQKLGYGSEAFKEKIRFCFEELGLRRLENGFFEDNSDSLTMQSNLGFKIEGTKRKAIKCLADGQYKDEIITALLKEEWIKA